MTGSNLNMVQSGGLFLVRFLRRFSVFYRITRFEIDFLTTDNTDSPDEESRDGGFIQISHNREVVGQKFNKTSCRVDQIERTENGGNDGPCFFIHMQMLTNTPQKRKSESTGYLSPRLRFSH